MMIIEKRTRIQKIKKIKSSINMKSFWSNKPIDISSNKKVSEPILSSSEILEKINKELHDNSIKLDYTVLESNTLTRNKLMHILEFINDNYIISNDKTIKLLYDIELFTFYCNNSIIIEFYPLNSKQIIGYIIGKQSLINIHGSILKSSDVNFLCLIPRLRGIGVSSFMINTLTKELVKKYNVQSAHYTISTLIKSPCFSEKYMYYKYLNFDKLQKMQYIPSNALNTFNRFHYDKSMNAKYYISMINGNGIDDNTVIYLYDTYMNYCKNVYNIYEIVDLENFKTTFINKMFYHFIIKSKIDDIIIGYISLFRLDTVNKINNNNLRSGYYYYMFFNEEIYKTSDLLEYVHKFIYENNIFDMITFSDIFDINYDDMKCIKGTNVLRYYLYNVKCTYIESFKNGLITI